MFGIRGISSGGLIAFLNFKKSFRHYGVQGDQTGTGIGVNWLENMILMANIQLNFFQG